MEVTCNLRADYPYRMECSVEAWAAILAFEATQITYDNFKNAVDKVDQGGSGPKRHNVYLRCWTALRSIEDEEWPQGAPLVRRYSTYGDLGWHGAHGTASTGSRLFDPGTYGRPVRQSTYECEACEDSSYRLDTGDECTRCDAAYDVSVATDEAFDRSSRLQDDVASLVRRAEPAAYPDDTVWADAATDAPLPPMEDDDDDAG